MQDIMGISDKFRVGDGRRTIAAADMWDNRDIEYRDTVIWIRQQRRRLWMVVRINGGREDW